MDTPSKPTGPSRYETLFGGATITVEVLDHEKREVNEERVFVRQIPVGEYDASFHAFGDEKEMVALYTGKPIAWVLSLAPSSFTLLVTEGARLNADFFASCDRRLTRDLQAARLINPAAFEELTRLRKSAGSPSPITSPTSRMAPV